MHGQYIDRAITPKLRTYLKEFPAVAILGPRQAGKSTLARHIIETIPDSVHLDLERPSDLRKLSDPELFFEANKDRLVCLDEIQKTPEIFTVLRGVIDACRKNGRFLILGSAAGDLTNQSSESLAGRIAYLDLTPFQIDELTDDEMADFDIALLNRYWFRGGFPDSYLAGSDAASCRWREQFLRTFLERDIPQLGVQIPSGSLGRFWRMLAHSHSELFNASKMGENLGMSHTTMRRYIDLLSKTYMVRILHPFEVNLKKRLVKSPKVYLRDSGMLHALLELDGFNALLGHPCFGASWEGLVIESLAGINSGFQAGFYRSSAGAELDLVLKRGDRLVGVECKASASPGVTRGFWNAVNDLQPDEIWIVAPVAEGYPFGKGILVKSLMEAVQSVREWK